MAQALNIVELLKAGLESQVKAVLTEEIVKAEMQAAEKRLREQIKPLVEGITFRGVENLKDMMRMREELHVYLHWDDKQKTEVSREI